jgi:hypothetical protein
VEFVSAVAGLEVITTVLLVDELHTDPALIAFFVIGLVALPTAFTVASTHRRQLFVPNMS